MRHCRGPGLSLPVWNRYVRLQISHAQWMVRLYTAHFKVYICVSFNINCAWSNLSIISPVCVLDYWKAPFLHALRYMVIDICYSIVQYVIIMHNSVLAWVRVIGCCMLQQPSSFIPRYVAGLSAGLTVAGSWIDRRPVGFRELLASMTSFIERGFTGRSLPSRSCSASICPGPPGCVWYVRWGSSGGMRDKHTLHTVMLPHSYTGKWADPWYSHW